MANLLQSLINQPMSGQSGNMEEMPTLTEQFEASLNPLHEAVWKSVKKGTDKIIEQRLTSGEDPGKILDSYGIQSPQQQTQPQPRIQQTLMMMGAALQGQDPSAVLKNLVGSQQQGMQNYNPQQLGALINSYNKELPEGYNAALSAEGRITASKTGQNLAEEKFNLLVQEKEEQKRQEGEVVKFGAVDTLDTIAKIEENVKEFGLTGAIPGIPGGKKYVWQTYVRKLISGKVVDLITQMKKASKTGATGFGQLSEKEGQILREASTALKFGLPPQEAKRILDRMKPLLEKVAYGAENQEQSKIKSFKSEKEAEASGVKGEVIINGRKARID